MVELTLLALSAGAEAASDALLEFEGALSVSVEDADAGTASEHALFGEPGSPPTGGSWNRSIIRALFSDADLAARAALSMIAAAGADLTLHSIAPVPEEDWVRLTQAQFTSSEVAPGFWIVPSWHQPPAQARRVIRLDPGMAFGTGTHPTTRMCLRWIAQQAAGADLPWERVLDYGCGSGILAIGAALHGARAVDAVDIDADAVQAATLNAHANGVAVRTGLPTLAQGHYAVVLANILATPLKLLAPLLCGHLSDGGELVLAGILDRQAEEMAAAYAPWLRLTPQDHEEGWVLMVGRSAAAPGACGTIPA